MVDLREKWIRVDFTRPFRQLYVPLLAMASFYLLEISLYSSIAVVLALMTLSRVGHSALAWGGFRGLPYAVSLVAGAALFVFSTQLLLVSGVKADIVYVSIGVLFITLCLVSVARQLADWEQPETAERQNATDAMIIAFTVMSVRHPWIVSFSVPTTALLWLHRSAPRTSRWMLAASSLASVGFFVAYSLRPEKWWYFYQGNDAQFFESLSWSISNWGVTENPGNVGSSIAGYHWFVYSFLGSLSHIAGLAPWDALMKIGAPLLCFGVASVILGAASAIPGSQLVIRLIMAIVGILCLPILRVDSFAFSLLAAMVFLECSVARRAPGHVVRHISVLALLATTLILGKTSTAVVVMLILAVELLIRRIRRLKASYAAAVTLAATGLLLLVTVFRSASQTGVSDFPATLSASLAEIQAFFDEPMLVFLFCLFLIGVLVSSRSIAESSGALYVATAVCIPIFIAFWFIQASGVSWYFGTPAIYLLLPLLVQRTSLNLIRPREKRMIIAGLLLSSMFLLAGLLHDYLMKRLDSRFRLATALGDFMWDILKNSGFALVFLVVIGMFRVFSRKFSPLTVVALLVSLMSFITGGYLDSYRKSLAWGPSIYENWSGNSSPFSQNDLRRLAEWIRSNTPKDAVLASNNFCCAGVKWWNEIKSDPELHRKTVFREEKWGGANFLLPAETRRRFLIQGLRFQVGYGVPTEEQIDRLTTSLEFANSPSSKSLHKLLDYGVSGFVVNLSLTEQDDWSQFATERVRHGDFVFLELRTDS